MREQKVDGNLQVPDGLATVSRLEMGDEQHGQCRCNPVYDFIESILDAFLATITRVVVEDAGNHGRATPRRVACPR